MFKEFNSLLELITVFPDEQTCIEYLEYVRWEGNVVSPYDPSSKVYKCKGKIISARIQVNISMRKQVQCFIGPRFRCKNGLWLFGWSLPIRKAYLPCS